MAGPDIATMNELADAYRAALAAGDLTFPKPSQAVERKLLLAAVASSAASVSHWVETRVADGSRLAAPLKELVPALQQGNVVGTGLDSAQRTLTAKAREAAMSLLFAGAGPAWLVSLVLAATATFGKAQEAGTSLGAVLIPALLGSSALAFGLLRGGSALVQSLGETWRELWGGVDGIGAAASGVFVSHLSGPLLAVGAPAQGVVPVIGRIRLIARVVLAGTALVLAVCTLYFLSGIWAAWEAFQACPFPELSQFCPPQ